MPRYIGLMSGTSMDAVDAVLIDLAAPAGASRPTQLIATYTLPLPADLHSVLAGLAHRAVTFDEITQLDVVLGRLFAEAANGLLAQTGDSPESIAAIGSHGQTVYHRPQGTYPSSIQLGDPNLIAELTGITTVADFRRRDLAAGGQGAPLVPAFHQMQFAAQENRVIVNIGGIANITVLATSADSTVTGFDTGPGNVLMDAWCARHRRTPYDPQGAWAAQGRCHSGLLAALLSAPYFSLPPPKSTGREAFHPAWLEGVLARFPTLPPADVQATLCELTATTITQSILSVAPATERVLVCGGGAYNDTLLQRLGALLAPRIVTTTAEHGIGPRWVEAAAFAWLAQRTLAHQPGNLTTVTGARRPVILGGVYYAA